MTKKKNENDEVYTRYKNIVKLFAGNSTRAVTMETRKMMYLFCMQSVILRKIIAYQS